MESPSRALTLCPPPPPQLHSPNPSRRRRGSEEAAASPEFEFWNIGRNPEPVCATFLHSADELFSDGVLLPLHFLPSSRSEPDDVCVEPGLEEVEVEPGPSVGSPEPSALITSKVTSNANPILSASKRWKEIIFKRGNNSNSSINNNNSKSDIVEVKSKVEKVGKKGKKEKKSGNNSGIGGGNCNINNNSVATELNINIWPFSRSRSAGNNSSRSNKPAASNRKVSSAPCSRSNSSGESKSSRRSWPSSPGRPGVHLGRAGPVWQAKRGVVSGNAPPGGARKGRVLKLNVPVCIGYRQQMSCRSDESEAVLGGGGSGGGGLKTGGGSGTGGNGTLFGLRGLFSKKNSAAVLTV